eukprot:s1701_g6.t1
MLLEVGNRTEEADVAWKRLYKLERSAAGYRDSVLNLRLGNRGNACYCNAMLQCLLYASSWKGGPEWMFAGSMLQYVRSILRREDIFHVWTHPLWVMTMRGWRLPSRQHDIVEFFQYFLGCQPHTEHRLRLVWQARAQQEDGGIGGDGGTSSPLLLQPPERAAMVDDYADYATSVQRLIEEWHEQDAMHAALCLPQILTFQAGRFDYSPESGEARKRRPEVGGKILVGSVEPQCDEDYHIYPEDPEAVYPGRELSTLTDQWTNQVYRLALRMPSLNLPDSQSAQGCSACYDVTEDWVPIYDKSSLPGFYMAIGTSGNQFKNAGVVGRLMRELIEATEGGQDLDSNPLDFQMQRIPCGGTISSTTFSRKRQRLQTSGSVLGVRPVYSEGPLGLKLPLPTVSLQVGQAVAMDPSKPTSTTRGMLPGIPHYVDRVSAECIWKETLEKETRLFQEGRKANPGPPAYVMNLANAQRLGDPLALKMRHSRLEILAPKVEKNTPQAIMSGENCDPNSFDHNALMHTKKMPCQKWDVPCTRAQEIGWLIATRSSAQAVEAMKVRKRYPEAEALGICPPPRSESMPSLDRRLPEAPPDKRLKQLNNNRFYRPKTFCDITMYADNYMATMHHDPFSRAGAGR